MLSRVYDRRPALAGNLEWGEEFLCENKVQDIYILCGLDRDGKVRAVITHYNKEDATPEKEVSVDFGRSGEFEIYLLDNDNDAALINTTSDLTFKMPAHSAIMIKEK